MVAKTSARLLKDYPKGYGQVFNQAFTNLPRDAGFNKGLSAPQPDFVEGMDMEHFFPLPVDERVPGAVLYADDPHSVTLAHVAGEWKGPGKNMEEARLQAAFDGAALVYGRDQAHHVVSEGAGDTGSETAAGQALVTTFTADGRHLNLFAHYAAEAENGVLLYHQYPIRSHNLVDSYDGFKEGRKQLRNAQDLAREESHALRDALLAQWRSGQAAPEIASETTGKWRRTFGFLWPANFRTCPIATPLSDVHSVNIGFSIL